MDPAEQELKNREAAIVGELLTLLKEYDELEKIPTAFDKLSKTTTMQQASTSAGCSVIKKEVEEDNEEEEEEDGDDDVDRNSVTGASVPKKHLVPQLRMIEILTGEMGIEYTIPAKYPSDTWFKYAKQLTTIERSTTCCCRRGTQYKLHYLGDIQLEKNIRIELNVSGSRIVHVNGPVSQHNFLHALWDVYHQQRMAIASFIRSINNSAGVHSTTMPVISPLFVHQYELLHNIFLASAAETIYQKQKQ